MLAPALHFRIVSGRETNRGPVSRSHELLPSSPQIRRIPTNRWNDVARCPRGSSVFSNDALASRERGGGHVWTRRKLIFDGVRGFDYRVKTNRLYQWNLITPYDYHNRGFSNCFYQCDGIGNVCVCGRGARVKLSILRLRLFYIFVNWTEKLQPRGRGMDFYYMNSLVM